MTRRIWIITLATLLAGCSREPTRQPTKLTAWVDPFIGTGGHGHTFPGATLPFGMVQLSPDTRLEGWDGCSGYHDTDNVVYGFSHTHLTGTGIADYCDILLIPTVGDIRFANGYPDRPDDGYASRFRKETESASPGYYEVHLDDYDVDVALTCTERVGFHRYTYPPTQEANIIIDLEHRDKVLDSGLAVVGADEIEGYRISSSWAKEQHVYFVARFSKPFASYGIALGDSIIEPPGLPGSSTGSARDTTVQAGTGKPGGGVTGTNIKGFFRFATDAREPVLVKVGISAVDIDGARKNLNAEVPHWDFDSVHRSADSTWEKALGKIVIEDEAADHADTDARKTIFYTALYHTMIAPNLFSDVDGRYRGTDLDIHQTTSTDVYTIFSLWDTFRAAHPLYTIIERERTLDFVQTLLLHYDHGGRLPMWELAGNYTGTMIGYHAVSVIVDAYVKRITGFSAARALEAMMHSAEQDHLGLDTYKQNGFIAAHDESESVSKTLEYAYDDWCIARMSRELSRKAEYSKYVERGQSYKNLYDPSTGFMRARTSSGWFAPFDPAEVNFNYTEANAWQYSFFAPQDVEGLFDLMGGREKLEQKLDDLFEAPTDLAGRDQADITGLIGQYAHGNEPSHHIAYLYNYVGQPWKTQRRARQIMDELYAATPDGLAGNEDCGQLSAWYVLSAMGFYPVTPGLAFYAIGTPLFERVTIHLENGNTFIIGADRVSDQNIYIQSATLNGETYTNSYLNHEAIMNGGELLFVMGPEPNRVWGSGATGIPVTGVSDYELTPVPYFVADSKTFTDSLTVELGVMCDCEIVVNIDRPRHTTVAKEYRHPLILTESATIRAVALSDVRTPSRTAVAQYIKIPGGRSITLHTQYAGQYAGGGDHALIDYQRGTDDFRTGSWQGYEGVDLDAVLDLGKTEQIGRISAGFLQDIRSWIWFPTEVEIALSSDGENFTVAVTIQNDFPDDEYGAFLKEFSADVTTRARYIRVRAKNYGECPEWHPGAGGKTWIFVDEIVVE
jgi:predicted alpha-1,2-mannosidase